MKRRLLVICIGVLLVPAVLRADSYGTELPFVAGAGARVSAMGLAGVSLCARPSSQYYNPAALALQEYRQLEAYRTTLFDSKSSYLAASYAHPTLDFGTIGVSLLRVGVGGIEERDESNTLLSTDLKNSTTRVLLGYAAEVTRALALGANLKIDHQQLAGASGTGVGLDFGAVAGRAFSDAGFLRRGRAGLMIENVVEPSAKLEAEDVSDPMRVAAGVSLDARANRVGVTTAVDIVSPRYSPLQLRAGLELEYREMVALRAGIDDDTPTFGLGVTLGGAHVDYAFRDEELGSNHRFSIAYAFGPSKSNRLQERQEQRDADMHGRLSQRIQEFEDAQLGNLLSRADSLFTTGNFAAAEEQYGSVLAWDPTHTRAADRRDECRFHVEVAEGRACSARREYATALYHFRRADERRRGDASVEAHIAECEKYIREGRDREAMVNALLARSIDLYAEGRLGEALTGFREVLRIDHDNDLATEYERKSAVSIKATVEQSLSGARAKAERRDFDAAVDILEQARALAPEDTRIDAAIAAVRKLQQSEQAARPAARVEPAPASRAAPDESVLLPRYREGIRLFEQGRFGAAAAELLVVWTAAPSFRNVSDTLARAYLFLGMQAYSKGSYEEAIATWERVLAIDPNNAKARRYLRSSREEASRLGAVKP